MNKLASCCLLLCIATFLQASDRWLFPPAVLSSVKGNNLSDAKIGIDETGTSYAVWQENSVITTSSAPFGTSWSTPLKLSDESSSSPQIFVTPNGYVAVIWVSSEIIYASVCVDQKWSSPAPISSSGSANPLLAGDIAGNLVALWENGGSIQCSTLLLGKAWSDPETLVASNASTPALSVSEDGHVLVAWTQTDTTTPMIYAVEKKIPEGWSIPTLLSNPSVKSSYPSVSIGNQGQAIIAWFTYEVWDSTYEDVYIETTTRYTKETWTTPVKLSEPGCMNPQNLNIQASIANNGSSILIWTNSLDGSLFSLQSMRKAKNSDWDCTPFQLGTFNPSIYSLDVASEPEGCLMIVWMTLQEESESLEISSLLSCYTLGSFYMGNFFLSSTGNNYYPYCAIAKDQENTVFYGSSAWLSSDGAKTSILAVQGRTAFPLPPSNVKMTSTQKSYAIFNNLYYTLNWEPSPDKTIVAYNIYRNGILIYQDYTLGLEFIDYNRVAEERITYEIKAFGPNGLESKAATITYP